MASHNPPTTQQLDDIETRANAATPGPWTVELEQCDCSDGYCHHGTYVSAIYAADGERRTEIGDFPDADWQFTIHARTDVPLLLAEVRRLNAELASQVRYAAALEADLCTCEPLCESGEYLHAADCPVVDIQMQAYGGPSAEETHVVADDSDDPEHVDDCHGRQPTPAP